MAHLSPEELCDLIEVEGHAEVSPSSQRIHLTECSACQLRLDDAKKVLALVSDVAVPEPSPLFWDHLSVRVRDAVRLEREAPASPWKGWLSWRTWPTGQAVAVGAVASVVVLASAVAIWRESPSPTAPISTAAGDQLGAGDAPLPEDEASLSLLAGLAGELSWEDVSEAGLSMRRGTVESVMMELTAEERLELQRLLQKELAAPSAGIQSS
jgi:hypothetical protein